MLIQSLLSTVARTSVRPQAAMAHMPQSFIERMHAHHAWYQEQVEAQQLREIERASAARRKRKKVQAAWRRVVAAVLEGGLLEAWRRDLTRQMVRNRLSES